MHKRSKPRWKTNKLYLESSRRSPNKLWIEAKRLWSLLHMVTGSDPPCLQFNIRRQPLPVFSRFNEHNLSSIFITDREVSRLIKIFDTNRATSQDKIPVVVLTKLSSMIPSYLLWIYLISAPVIPPQYLGPGMLKFFYLFISMLYNV